MGADAIALSPVSMTHQYYRILDGGDRLTEVSRFHRDRQLVQASKKLSETAFQHVWDNPDDAEDDQL